MNASQLRAHVEATGSFFFTRKTMAFFGDTMRNFGVRRAKVRRHDGTTVDAWELYRRRPVKHGLSASHFFSVDDFSLISGERVD